MIWPVDEIINSKAFDNIPVLDSGYPSLVVTPEPPTVFHAAAVDAAIFGDGNRVITGGADGTARVSRIQDGKAIEERVVHHQSSVGKVLFNQTNNTFITTSLDGTARIWPLHAYKNKLSQNWQVSRVAFGATGKRLAVGGGRNPEPQDTGEGGVATYDHLAARLSRLNLPGDKEPMDLAFRADGKLLIGYDDRIMFADGPKQDPRRLAGLDLAGPEPFELLEFSADAKRLAAVRRYARVVKVWDLNSNKLIQTFNHGHGIWSFALSPDGNWLATSGGYDHVKIWKMTGELATELPAHGNAPWAMAFSEDGQKLAMHVDGGAWIWDVASQRRDVGPLEHDRSARRMLFTKDGKTLVTASQDHQVRLWDVRTGLLIAEPFYSEFRVVDDIALSPDDRLLASAAGWPFADGAAYIWDYPALLKDDPQYIQLWVEVHTGVHWDEARAVTVPLSFDEWTDRYRQLDSLDQGSGR